jgi:hypothetical protein
MFRLRWLQFCSDLEPLTGCKNLTWTRQPPPNYRNTLTLKDQVIKAIRLVISTDGSVYFVWIQFLTLSPSQNSVFIGTKVRRAHEIVLAWT